MSLVGGLPVVRLPRPTPSPPEHRCANEQFGLARSLRKDSRYGRYRPSGIGRSNISRRKVLLGVPPRPTYRGGSIAPGTDYAGAHRGVSEPPRPPKRRDIRLQVPPAGVGGERATGTRLAAPRECGENRKKAEDLPATTRRDRSILFSKHFGAAARGERRKYGGSPEKDWGYGTAPTTLETLLETASDGRGGEASGGFSIAIRLLCEATGRLSLEAASAYFAGAERGILGARATDRPREPLPRRISRSSFARRVSPHGDTGGRGGSSRSFPREIRRPDVVPTWLVNLCVPLWTGEDW